MCVCELLANSVVCRVARHKSRSSLQLAVSSFLFVNGTFSLIIVVRIAQCVFHIAGPLC